MELTLKLPKNTTCVSLSYVFEDESRENLFIGNAVVNRDDLISGHFVCKGAENNDRHTENKAD